jgi:oxygen-independent coproporphyrinogen III oxidase
MAYPLSVYIHIPFCVRRCNYCDFVSFAGMDAFMKPYVEAVCREIDGRTSLSLEKPHLHTIFFGGGTPSVIPVHLLGRILMTIRQDFIWEEPVEISLEANPGTLDLDKCKELLDLGFNRISLGVQSFFDPQLELLGRIHTAQQAVEAYHQAREAGFTNINLDLIYGLPNQSLADWQGSLQQAVQLSPEHLSLYSLTVEEGTSLWEQVEAGQLPMPDPDIAADMLGWSCDYLEEQGYSHYEISNWARRQAHHDLRAWHNLQYWRNEYYYGFGVGAHSYIDGIRSANGDSIPEYIQQIKGITHLNVPELSISQKEPVDRKERMQDEMMLGLRLLQDGVNYKRFFEKFGVAPADVFGEQIRQLIRDGLLEEMETPQKLIRLTRRGMFLGNQVFMQFVGED